MSWIGFKKRRPHILGSIENIRFNRSTEVGRLRYGTAEVHNSDQGSQFTAGPYIDKVQQSGMIVSMDGKGRALVVSEI